MLEELREERGGDVERKKKEMKERRERDENVSSWKTLSSFLHSLSFCLHFRPHTLTPTTRLRTDCLFSSVTSI